MIAPLDQTAAGGSFTVGQDRLRLLRDGTVAHAAMLEAIASAAHEVLLEMYWIGADHAGGLFRDALAERARAGVEVRVIYDAIGSFGLPDAFWVPLLEAGGEVREFAPIAPWRKRFELSRIRFRDHRKNLIVDREVGFAGGINLGDAWAPLEGLGWRDDAIEIRGPSALPIRKAFFKVWTDLGGSAPADDAAAGAALVSRDVSRHDAPVQVLTNEIIGGPNRAIRHAYLQSIAAAKVSIMIASAYFLPGAVFLFALRQAARRGVRVRVLVPARSDVWLATLATSSILGRLLDDGVEVFAYTGRVLHSKTAVFDERSVMIGSHNLDAMSWRFNLECDVMVEDAAFAAHAARSFDADCAEAQPLSLEQWRARPVSLRLLAWFVALFRKLL